MRQGVTILHHLYETQDMIEMYKKIKEKRATLASLHPAMQKLAREEISSIRQDLRNNYGYSSYEVVIKHKDKTNSQEFPEWPTHKDIRAMLDEMYAEVRVKRKKLKVVNEEEREVMGLSYTTVGGVFTRPIRQMITKESIEQIIKNNKSPHPKMKDNYVGIELECIVNADRKQLEAAFIKNKLQSNVHVGTDGSLRPDHRGGSCYEVRVLVKERDISVIIPKIVDVLKSFGGYVNNTCGMHVHLDMRHRNVSDAYTRLFRARGLLQSMVSADRLTNTYCTPNTHALYSAEYEVRTKYKQINVLTYDRLKTLEVRLHGGCLTSSKIVNWIKLLTYITDTASAVDTVTATNFMVAYPDMTAKMQDYIMKRVADVSRTKPDVTADETTYIQYEMAV